MTGLYQNFSLDEVFFSGHFVFFLFPLRPHIAEQVPATRQRTDTSDRRRKLTHVPLWACGGGGDDSNVRRSGLSSNDFRVFPTTTAATASLVVQPHQVVVTSKVDYLLLGYV